MPLLPGTPGVQPEPSVVPQGNTLPPVPGVQFGGDGFGSVTIRAAGVADQVCERYCLPSLPLGTLVTVEATAQPNSVFRGWSDPACGAQPVCSFAFDPSAALRADFQLAYNVAFATDLIYSGAQMPAAGAAANQECARFAAAAGLHGQRWVAWFAAQGRTTAPADEITPAGFLQNPGGWVRTDGSLFATTREALLSGGPRNPLSLTQTRVPAVRYSWSGAALDGTIRRVGGRLSNCNNWTAATPDVTGDISSNRSVGVGWTGDSTQACDASASLQCFGDDPAPAVPLPPLPASARLAFLSTTLFTPAAGIPSADYLCQQDACAAGLTGSTNCSADPGSLRTFLSYLFTTLLPAWERFDLSGPTWYRPDGIQWLPAAASLGRDAQDSLTGMNVMADGTLDQGSNLFWVGSTYGQNCGDWTNSAVAGDHGNFQEAGSSLASTSASCDTPAKVLCLQQ
jgi:hypothetical protein